MLRPAVNKVVSEKVDDQKDGIRSGGAFLASYTSHPGTIAKQTEHAIVILRNAYSCLRQMP